MREKEREGTKCHQFKRRTLWRTTFSIYVYSRRQILLSHEQIAPLQSVNKAFCTISVTLTVKGLSVVIISSIVELNFQYSFESSQFIFQSKRFVNWILFSFNRIYFYKAMIKVEFSFVILEWSHFVCAF